MLQSGGFTSIMQSGVRGKGNHEQKRTEPLFKRRRKKAVYRWKAVRKNRQREKRQEKDQKGRLGVRMLIFVCIMSGRRASAKDWQSGNRTAEIRIDSLPAFIEIHPFYEEEFRREKENASRTEQGISLFLKEGRIVFFRIHEEACDD